jgi:serine/threonine protein kinase/WD40 repeat protein
MHGPAGSRSPMAIFNEALDLDSSSHRAAYLDGACAGDPALRARVGALLAAHDRAGAFLESPALTDTVEAGRPERPEDVGTTIGPYKLLEEIGEGGMGTVYMAEQTEPVRRRVALKVIKPGMDTRQVVARFEAERQALAMMDHPSIAKVHDAGTTAAGRPYFVMELVRGLPITDYCDKARLPIPERLRLFVLVCRAVQHAHQKGVIHRDLKPSNVLVTLVDGSALPIVIDFGVAKATGGRLTDKTLFTGFAQLIGTPLYMSPEQAEYSGADADTRSDVYSLGVLLYELLTGTTPIPRETLGRAALGEVLRILRDQEPPTPSNRLGTLGPALPAVSASRLADSRGLGRALRGELDWIVMKALEKDRGRRYSTANDFADDVVRSLNDEPVWACPPSGAYRVRKFARRNRAAITTAIVLVAALLLGTIVSTWQAIRATRGEGLARSRLAAETRAKDATREQLRLTARAEDLATRRLYEARLAQARAGRFSRRVGQRLDGLDALARAATIAGDLGLTEGRSLELRNAAIACLTLPDLRLAGQWPGWPAGSSHFDFDGALEQYARSDRRGAVSVRRVADDRETASLPGSAEETWVRFSPDGKFLAVWSTEGLTVWGLGGAAPAVVVRRPAGECRSIDFRPDSRECAIGLADGSILLHGLTAGGPFRRLPGDRSVVGLAYSPSGLQLAVSCMPAVQVRDVDTGGVVADLLHPALGDTFAWHPDGKTLAVTGSDCRIYLWDVESAKQTLVLEGTRNGGINLAFNHSGDLLASVGWDWMLRLWNPRTGKQIFSTPSQWLATPRFSPDDRLLAGDRSDDKLGLWVVAAGGEYRTLSRTPAAGDVYFQPTVHRDGRLLAVGMREGVGFWDLNSGLELAFIPAPGDNHALFEPSGSLLTNGPAGLLRWPVRLEPSASGPAGIGPPRRLSVPGSMFDIACSGDGRVIASAQSRGGMVLHADRPDRPIGLSPHHDTRYVAVSPDGRWVTTGSHSQATVKVWDARSGRLVKELALSYWLAVFSPDSKWLGTDCRLWEVGSWRGGPKIEGTVAAFSPDGRILATETGSGSVRLVDPATGHEYARLEDPDQDRATSLAFSPDCTRLVACNRDTRSIHVWDLRAIRAALAGMGLDWALPSYAPAVRDETTPPALRVSPGELPALIEAQRLRREALGSSRAGRWNEAIGGFTRAIERDPKDAGLRNSLAWLLATCPEEKFRDTGRALALALEAVEMAPGDGLIRNTLGAAHYRVGDWPAAIEALEKSEQLLGGQGSPFNAFFLAMAHGQSGNKGVARHWFDRAVAERKEGGPPDEELRRFRAEAEELLGRKAGDVPPVKGGPPPPK